MDELLIQIQHLENVTQAQAELIESLTSKGVFGWAQRRRVRAMMQGKQLVRRLREDDLRAHVARLKKEVAELRAEADNKS